VDPMNMKQRILELLQKYDENNTFRAAYGRQTFLDDFSIA
jgi:hypothetical protein